MGINVDRSAEKTSVSEVFLEQRSVGHLFQSAFRGYSCIRFTKGVPIKRRDVVTLLRSLAYKNISHKPTEGRRYVRVMLNCGSWTSTQCILGVDVRAIDDVTEITMMEDRLRFRQCPDDAVLPFRLFPLGRAIVQDPDTVSFGGGHLVVELVAGGGNKDSLSILNSDQQFEQIRRKGPEDTMCYDTDPELCVLQVADRKTIRLPEALGGASVNVSYPRSSTMSGATDLKISFPSEASVPPAAVSYILNCVAFSPGTEKYKETSRTYLVRVSDGTNPQEGKIKVVVEARLPLLTHPAMVLECGLGASISPLQRVAVGAFFEGQTFLTSGYVAVQLQGALCEDIAGKGSGDALVVNLKAAGMRLEGQNLLQGPVPVGVLAACDARLFRVDFVAGGKTQKQQLLQLIQCVSFKAHTQLARDAMIEVDGGTDSTTDFSLKEIRITVAEEDLYRTNQLVVPVRVK
eukprot:Hpha_TRINITY_DN15232_c1_g2::TRINITY_DN15232_c1_g2_i1::g.66508::m.66508